MTYDLQEFPNTPPRIDGSIRIGKTGRIGLTKHFAETSDIMHDTKAHLYLDKARMVIVIRFTKTNDQSAYPVALLPNDNGAFIGAHAFFKAGDLDLEKYANRYRYQKQTGNDVGLSDVVEVLVVDLTKPIDARVEPVG